MSGSAGIASAAGERGGGAAAATGTAGRLPAFHVGRPGHVAVIERARTVVIEAAGGAGKSTLLAELARTTGRHLALLACQPRDREPEVLVADLAMAVAASGLTLDAPTGSAEHGLDEIAAAFGAAPAGAVLALDDAHLLSDAAAALVARLRDDLPARTTLVVLACRLPFALGGTAPWARTSSSATPTGHSTRPTSPRSASASASRSARRTRRRSRRATEGWAAAAVLAVARLARRSDPSAELARFAGRGDIFRPLVDAALARLEPDARRVRSTSRPMRPVTRAPRLPSRSR